MTRSHSIERYSERSFRLGDQLVDPSTNSIGNVRVDPKAMDVLAALAEAAPQVLSAAALLDRVWPNVVVGDNSLFQAIAQVRKALGDPARAPRFIEHVPRRGYRLLVAVEWLAQPADPRSSPNDHVTPLGTLPGRDLREIGDGTTAAARSATRSTDALLAGRRLMRWSGVVAVALIAIVAISVQRGAERSIKTVAVFPFENMTGDLALDDIARGVSDELRRRLGPIPQLRIVAADSMQAPQLLGLGALEIAPLLGNSHSIRGQLQRSGDEISVVVHLEDAQGAKLWSGRFQRDKEDLLDLQTDLNASTVSNLIEHLGTEQTAMLHRQPTNDARAWELYLRARRFKDHFTLDTLDAAIEQLEEAITRDSGFALAYAALADVNVSRPQIAHLPSQEGFEKAQRYIDEALRLDSDLAEAQSYAAEIRDMWLWDRAGARRMHLRAIELDPNLPEAWIYLAAHYLQFGEWEKARKPVAEIKRLDPLGPYAAILSSSMPQTGYWYSRDRRLLDEALVAVEDAKRLDSRYWVVFWGECMLRFARDEFAQAVGACRRAIRLVEDTRVVEPDLAAALVRSGQRAEAEAIVESLEKRMSESYFSPARLALAQAELGNVERSLELLESALKDHDWEIFWIAPSTHFDAMRALPRFKNVYRALDIPEPALGK